MPTREKKIGQKGKMVLVSAEALGRLARHADGERGQPAHFGSP